MIYIYDLILNWCRNRKYEFFEWKENDEVEYIKKMPVLKIKDFDNICNNDVKVGNDFLEKIYNKSEVYGSKKIEKVEYACIFCDEFLSKAIAIEFDMNGCSLYKSFIYFYDLDDVFDLAKKTDLLELDFSVIEINNDEDKYLTREEIERKKLLINDINNSYKNNDIDKLKYFYYEIFEEKNDDINIVYERLVNSLNDNFDYKHSIIYDVVKMPNL